jgi:hypothetical protein
MLKKVAALLGNPMAETLPEQRDRGVRLVAFGLAVSVARAGAVFSDTGISGSPSGFDRRGDHEKTET